MAEIEIGIMSCQALAKPLPDLEGFKRQLRIWTVKRNAVAGWSISSLTKNSRALREESEKSDIASSSGIKQQIRNLWDNLPVFRDNMYKVPALHVSYRKDLIRGDPLDSDYMINTKGNAGASYL